MHCGVDYREAAALKLVEGKAFFVSENLLAGDFVLYAADRRVLAAFERKTWADLAASLKDGRAENIKKMLALRAEFGARLFYVMEGARPTMAGGIAVGKLQAHLDHLQWRDGVFILYTRSTLQTVQRIEEIARNIPRVVERAEEDYKMPGEYEVIWRALPGFGAGAAKKLADVNPFVLFRPRADDEVAAVWAKCNKRQRETIEAIGGHKVKMLAAIKGVSEAMARRADEAGVLSLYEAGEVGPIDLVELRALCRTKSKLE